MGKHKALLLLVFLLISGCAQEMEKPTLEDYAFIGVLGFDYAGKDQIKVTATAPRPQNNQNQSTEIYQTTVPIFHEALPKLNRETDRSISTAQLRVVLVSDEFARKSGIARLMKSLYRDASIGDALLVAVVEGSVEKLLKTTYQNQTEINTYLNNLLRPRGESDFIPYTTMHDLIFSLTDETIDPILPYIQLDPKVKKIKIAKIALLKNDKLVDTITPEEGKILYTFFQHINLSTISLTIQEKGEKGHSKVVLNAIRSENKIRSKGKISSPSITINTMVKCSILEYSGKKDLENREEVNALEAAISRELEKKTKELVKKLQKLQVDPMFLGEYVRQNISKENWSKEKWRSIFPKTTVSVHVHTLVVSSGTLK